MMEHDFEEGSLDDPDEVKQIFEEMTLYEDEGDEPVVLDYKAMDQIELLEAFNATFRELSENDALLVAHNEHEQDLQAQYYGLFTELKKRGLK